MTYNQYVAMNMTEYELRVALRDTEYSGTPVEGQEVTLPEKHVMSVEGNLKTALSTPLVDLETYGDKPYHYVVYGAIDLMNYYYTEKDKNNKVV